MPIAIVLGAVGMLFARHGIKSGELDLIRASQARQPFRKLLTFGAVTETRLYVAAFVWPFAIVTGIMLLAAWKTAQNCREKRPGLCVC